MLDTTEPDVLTLPLARKDRRHLRHRWQPVMVTLSTLITLGALTVAAIFAAAIAGNVDFSGFFTVQEFEKIREVIVLILLAPFAFMALRTLLSSQASATGVVATEEQFEHVHLMAKHYSRLAGLSRTPLIAVVASGSFTAKSTSNFGKSVIMVSSDLLDAPRPSEKDWGALRFAIAREVGHLAAGHRSLLYELSTAVTQNIPYVSHMLKRAEEYTADRYAAALAADAAADYFAVIAVSKDCWQEMSSRATAARAGKARLGQIVTAWIGKVPPLAWRLQALVWLGVFLCETLPSEAGTPAEYRDFLQRIPMCPLNKKELKQRHGAFWLPPRPMTEKELDELCPRGTNFERLTAQSSLN